MSFLAGTHLLLPLKTLAVCILSEYAQGLETLMEYGNAFANGGSRDTQHHVKERLEKLDSLCASHFANSHVGITFSGGEHIPSKVIEELQVDGGRKMQILGGGWKTC